MKKILFALVLPPLSIFCLTLLFGHSVLADARPGPDVILPFELEEFLIELSAFALSVVILFIGFRTLFRLTGALRTSWLFLMLGVSMFFLLMVFNMLSALNLFRAEIFFEIIQIGIGLGFLGSVISFRRVFSQIASRKGK